MNCLHNTFMQVILHKTQCNRISLNFLDRKFYNRNSRLRSPHRKTLHFSVTNALHHKVSNHISNNGFINSATYDTNNNLRIPNSCQKKGYFLYWILHNTRDTRYHFDVSCKDSPIHLTTCTLLDL